MSLFTNIPFVVFKILYSLPFLTFLLISSKNTEFNVNCHLFPFNSSFFKFCFSLSSNLPMLNFLEGKSILNP